METVLNAPTRKLLRVLGVVLVVAGMACIGWWLFWTARLEVAQANARQRITELQSSFSPAFVPLEPERSQVLGTIDIPRLGLSAVVLFGSDAATLDLGVGAIESTALPGEVGNIGLAAHRNTIFRPLEHIREDDEILITSAVGVQRYLVESIRIVAPTQVEVLAPTSDAVLTLVTCFPFDYVGAAPKRFIVRAVAAAATHSRVRDVSEGE